MVAQATQLTDRESRLLEAYITSHFDLSKFKMPDLLFFINSPAIQLHIARLKNAFEDACQLRTLQSRTHSIDALESIATFGDPIERRRAATTLVRNRHTRAPRAAVLPLSAAQTAEAIARALAARDTESIHPFITPKTRLDNRTATAADIQAALPDATDSHAVEEVRGDEDTLDTARDDATRSFTLTFHRAKSKSIYALTLANKSNTWVILSLDRHDSG